MAEQPAHAVAMLEVRELLVHLFHPCLHLLALTEELLDGVLVQSAWASSARRLVIARGAWGGRARAGRATARQEVRERSRRARNDPLSLFLLLVGLFWLCWIVWTVVR